MGWNLKMKMWVSAIILAVLSVSCIQAEYCDSLYDCDDNLWCCENSCNTYEYCYGIDEDTFNGLLGLSLALTIIIPLLCCCCCCGCIGTGVYFFMRSRRRTNTQ